jgi:Tol biopolymer transport system component
MAELPDRFRSLDRIAVPDLWADVEQRAVAAAPKPLSPVAAPSIGVDLSGLTRSRPVRLALVLAALIVLLLALALLAGGRGRFTSPLVFATFAGEGGEGLYVVDRAGAEPKAIFKGRAGGISVSPDGRYVLFSADDATSRDPSYTGPNVVLTLMHTDGSGSRTFTDSMDAVGWARDSHAIAWASGQGDQSTLTIVDVDGDEPHRFAVPPRASAYIAWSPDNIHLAYGGFDPAKSDPEADCQTTASVLIVNTMSGEYDEIGPLYPVGLPVWAHDGRHVAAAAWPEDVSPARCEVIPADGIALVSVDVVTDEFATVMTAPDVDYANLDNLAWSADDHSILGLIASATGRHDAFAVPADGGAVKIVAHDIGNVGVRSPDGSQLARAELDSESTDTYSLWVIDLADGQRRRVAWGVPYGGSDGDGWPIWSPDGEWIAFHREPSGPTIEWGYGYPRRVGGEGSIWIVRPDGSDEQLIVDDSFGLDAGQADW